MALREDISDRARHRVNTTLKGKWTLDGVLGVGGMATVYAATHRNQSRVAIKMLHPEVALDAEVTARFLREGYVANTVDHPGTVQVFDDDVTEDGAAFLVMELLEGETLESRWERKGHQLPVSEVLPVVDQLLDVLASAHAKGVIHRDLKPENLFLTKDGRLKVLDFGIARLRELSKQTGATTKVGSLLGTPAFMAPEQALGRLEEVDQRTDLWAVGATLFTLLTGRYVHEADTINEQLILAATNDAPSVAQFCPSLPMPVVRLVDRALAFKKSERWDNARAMQGGLREAQESLELTGPLSLPRPSVAGGAPPTITAPSVHSVQSSGSVDIVSAPSANRIESGIESVPALTTTGDALRTSDAPAPRRRWGAFIGAGVAALIGVGVILGLSLGSRVSAEQPDPNAGKAPIAAPENPQAELPKTDPKPEATVAEAAPTGLEPKTQADPNTHAELEGTQAPEPKAQPTPISKPIHTGTKPPATAKPPNTAVPPVTAKPPLTAKPPETAKPPSTATTPTANPFDRRH